MSYSEPPFAEYEERFLLAEILKRSQLPPQALFCIIRDAQIEPQWSDIALPYGRSVNSCQQAFAGLQAHTAQEPPGAFAYFRRTMTNPDLERANAAGRELHPRPPPFPGFNPPTGPTGYRFGNLEPPPRKKRGRPNKEEFERRAAEARARGEEYPKRRNKAQKRSAGDSNKDSPSKAESVASPADSRAGPSSVLSPGESGVTSNTQSAAFQLNSPASNAAAESRTSVSDASSTGRAPPSSGPDTQIGQSQQAHVGVPGGFGGILRASPTFPNQETGYGFSLPGTLSRDPQKQQAPSTGGPNIPHSQASSLMPPRDPYGYYPGTTFQGYGSNDQARPG